MIFDKMILLSFKNNNTVGTATFRISATYTEAFNMIDEPPFTPNKAIML